MNTRHYFTSVLLLLVITINAQNIVVEDSLIQDPQVRITHILQYIDDSQLNPPVLWDRGMDMVDLSIYDGVDGPTKITDTRIFGLAYGSLYSIPTNSANKLAGPMTAYSTEMQALSASDDIPIIVLHYNYHRLKPTAIGDGILYVDGDQLKETSGNTVSPFEAVTTFMAAPMMRVIHKQDISFVVKSQHHFGNSGKTVSSAQIDFGIGAGWQTLTLEVPLAVTYPSPGEKELRIKYNFTDNTSMENRALIEVVFTPVIPGQPLNGTFVLAHTTSEPDNGAQVDIYIDYNCDGDGIRKPLIFVEGFNPPELGAAQNLLPNNAWRGNFNFVLDGQNLYQGHWDDEGYDLIYIDYHDGGDYIQENAHAVAEAIRWVNEQKAMNGSNEPNVLIGSSMGGLVGKYALREMELAGEDHETELFVAMDSPMRGANIPLSVQYAARHIPNINAYFSTEFGDLIPEMRLGEQLLNRPAAKQMLIYQCENDVEGGQAGLYTSFMNEFHGMGDLSNAREIAISNGSQYQSGQPYGPHTKYFAATVFTWWENFIGPSR